MQSGLRTDEETEAYQCLSGLFQLIQLSGWRTKSRFHTPPLKVFAAIKTPLKDVVRLQGSRENCGRQS